MSPDTARAILAAMQNHRRPPRTRASKVMDAVAHVRNSQKEKASAAAGLKDFYSNERESNYRTSTRDPHMS